MRPDTDRLRVNPPLGHRPSLEFRRLAELEVDPSYQRSIDASASQALIRRIAMFWDWNLCQPLAVAKREDGALMVVDGQHRLAAARLRRDIEDLPCVVTAYRSPGDEAAAFVALNQRRRPLSPIDLFKAALAAEDERARAISRILTEAGLRLAPHTNFTAWAPGMVSNISGIQTAFREKGEKVTAAALTVLAKAFAGEVLRFAGTIFPGLAGAIAQELRVEGRVDEDRMAEVLSSKTQVGWRDAIALEAATSGVERPRAAKNLISRLYDGGARRAGPMVTVPARPAEAAIEAESDTPPQPGPRWCDQCELRVSAERAAACTSPFCKAKGAAA